MCEPAAIVSELYCMSEEKGKIVCVFMNEDFCSSERLMLSLQLVKPEEPHLVCVYEGIAVNKTLIEEKFGEVSASSRIFINSNLSLDLLL